MPTPFPLDILTPEHSFFSGQAEGVIVMTPDGEICILAGHEPIVTPLKIGSVRLNIDGQWKEALISEGFMEVGHSKTVIVTQACEWPENIDVGRAQATLERAREQLRQQISMREYKANQITMARAMARLRVTKVYDYNLK